jgi:DNA invertase Pin-like site-specific DNA recombinase
VTGAHNDRRELLKMLKALVPGDVVTVTRIDRLARSTFDLFAIVKQIVDAKAQFRSLAEPWADTGTSTGRVKMTEQQQAEARRRRAEVATLAELARSYHVRKSTISRLAV